MGLRDRGIEGTRRLEKIAASFVKNKNSLLFVPSGVIPFIRSFKMGERNGYEDLR